MSYSSSKYYTPLSKSNKSSEYYTPLSKDNKSITSKKYTVNNKYTLDNRVKYYKYLLHP